MIWRSSAPEGVAVPWHYQHVQGTGDASNANSGHIYHNLGSAISRPHLLLGLTRTNVVLTSSHDSHSP